MGQTYGPAAQDNPDAKYDHCLGARAAYERPAGLV